MNDSLRFHQWLKQTARTALSVFLLLLLLTGQMAPALAQEGATDIPLAVEGVSALLFSPERGQVLFAKQETDQLRVGLASRMMTVYLALTNAKPGAMVTASSEAASIDGAQLSLRVGEKYGVEALCHAVMLTGAPDAAVALGEFIGGDLTDFVGMMNVAADKAGMHATRFANSTGENDDKQYTTASDLSIFLRMALADAGFSRMFSTQAKPWYDDRKTTLLTNRNNLFWAYDGTDGGVSGSTDPQIESSITSATRNGMKLVCILLDVPISSRVTDTVNLFNYGFANYRYGKLVTAGQTLKTVVVAGKTLNLLARSDAYYVYPIGNTFVQDLTTTVDESKLTPPLLTSMVLGKAVFTLGDKTLIEVDLVPDSEILPKKTRWQLIQERMLANREILWLVGLLVVVEVFWILLRVGALVKRRIRRNRPREI
jgi:serine-type D-Ala-D-Ala carboxypeptidase (penicillin-binding protein 5/6)